MPKLTGRFQLWTDKTSIEDGDTMLEVLRKVLPWHERNRADIEYLYKYYKGDQPILHREKVVRPEINNKIVQNHAYEIVSFKTGYVVGEPVQYVAHSDEKDLNEAINRLNEYVFAEEKAAKDVELADWMHICGTGYRLILPDEEMSQEEDESPFEVYTLDPRFTFVVYERSPRKKPVMGVYYTIDDDNVKHFHCYTDKLYAHFIADKAVEIRPHVLGDIPIIEYPLNESRLGAFEVVLPLLDAINNVESDRLNAVNQFVESLMLFKNVDISAEDFSKLKEMGALKYRDLDSTMTSEVKYLTNYMNQSETQSLVDNLYSVVIKIAGIPNRNGGYNSAETTGMAIVLRDGFGHTETLAKNFEMYFKRSETVLLRIITRICRILKDMDLKSSDVELRFTRRNYENIQEKSQVLVTMLDRPDIHPRLAFEHSGMFADPQLAYTISMEYKAEQERKAAEAQAALATQNAATADTNEEEESGAVNDTETESSAN